MASRSDQLHSHQFALQRVVGALAMRDPDPVASPLRRMGGALIGGILVAAVALAAVGVYGLLRPGGNDAWRDGDAVIVDEKTGARYVYRDGLLHPVLNQASALLLAGSPRTVVVAGASLRDVPRGAPLGIPGAPDPLPAADALVTDGWLLCSRTVGGRPESVLDLGAGPAATSPLGPDEGLLVSAGDEQYLIWQRHRHAIRDKGVLGALWAGEPVVPVAPALINGIPPGPDLASLTVPDAGHPAAFGRALVGQVLKYESLTGSVQFLLALADGLAPITPVQAGLLLGNGVNTSGRATEITVGEYDRARKAAPFTPGAGPDLPAAVPRLARVAGGLCASFVDDRTAPEVVVWQGPPVAPGEARTGGVWQGAVVADAVRVAPGRGAVVEAASAPGAAGGALAVVTDQGVRYAVPSADALAALGYSGVRPTRLPAALVALIPGGPALDPVAAAKPATLAD
ncbi:type VII secretion protein EccB [Luedemannella helvata]|uniref:Type VII secretion protein EccB n=1 Tax=Luedemannella helvata TaxID=349315 RepID=A0ABP4VSC2_9ACTN